MENTRGIPVRCAPKRTSVETAWNQMIDNSSHRRSVQYFCIQFDRMNRILFFLLLAAAITSCAVGKKSAPLTVDDIQDLPELVITAEPMDPAPPAFPYRRSVSRPWDLLDIDVDIAFDWANSQAPATAILTMTPLQYPQEDVTLDAVGFLIHNVRLASRTDTLPYQYDGQKLTIALPGRYQPGDSLVLRIEYTARPEENDLGGSAAITSDKGLYFINPTKKYRNKPTQVWTQGETQANSRWVPTFDQPNERMTQTIRITVDTFYETLSNGLLTDQVVHEDGTRTDTWRMDQPHAPYLMMMAVGDYAISRQTWQGIPIEYYVEKPFATDAETIFPDAASMLSFFSDYTGILYPWPKLAQVPVRDYVSGAMENTSAVIYGEFVQRSARELIDETRNELICAHEIVHQWFGDLVTCESWSNVVLNEGFANYGEYLWLEFKYGREEAEVHRRDELAGYLNQAKRRVHPLVDFHYADREDMFDAHSYNKGGLVLNMLREYLGENAFRAGLTTYLTRHGYSAVEVHDLRLAMEAVTGEDLNWFFDQWYYQSGHPTVQWDWHYDPSTKSLNLHLEQVQQAPGHASLFILPTEVDVLLSKDRVVRFPILMDQRVQDIRLELNEEPILVDLDPDRIQLMVQEHADWSDAAAAAYWRAQPSVWSRLEILDQMGGALTTLQPYPWQDAQWQVRLSALEHMDVVEPGMTTELVRMAKEDPHSEVRARAVNLLEGQPLPDPKAFFETILAGDQAYSVVSAAINALLDLDREAGLQALRTLSTDRSVTATMICGALYAKSEDPGKLDYFSSAWEQVEGFPRLSFMKAFVDLVQFGSESQKDAAIDRLAADAGDNGVTTMRRYAAFRALAILRQHELDNDIERAARIKTLLDQIRDAETDPGLLRYYRNY